ncbi:MAG TPA: site-specific integrase, partial [Anaerovoracaceae bacterium]|nr:site-specific integrase [Anaerovoracaceae bacterium]
NCILKSFGLDDMLSSSGIAELYHLMTKEKKLKEVFDLTRIKEREDDGRNYVYINRTQFIGRDYADLINRLYDHFFGASTSTLESLFPDWMIWRRDHTKVTNKTLQENKILWHTMFASTEIVKMPLASLKAKDFIKFFREITKDRQITRKRFNDGKSILNSIYYYAIEQEIVESNPLKDINYRIFSYKPINDKPDVFTLEERAKLLKYLEKIENIYSLAIQLDFHIIARIGELKSLEWSDISGDTIRVQTQLLMEQTMNDDLSFNVRTPNNVAHIKGNTSHGFRDMPLTPNAKRILKQIKKINPNGQYILMHDGKQLSTVTFNRYLRQYCKEAGVPYKSSHKIRFTVASLLYKNGVSATQLQEWLGHSQLTMTLHYLRNITTEDDAYNAMASVLG